MQLAENCLCFHILKFCFFFLVYVHVVCRNVVRDIQCSSFVQVKYDHKDSVIIGINHGFQCSNIRWITRKVFEHKAAGRVFKHLPSDPANV